MENQFETIEPQEKVNIINELNKYVVYWKWFVVSVFIFLFGAYTYLRYTPNVYNSSAKIKILDNSTSSFKMPTDGISLFGRSKINLENEVEVIKSLRLLSGVVKELNLTTSYATIGYITESESWGNHPFKVEWLLPKDSLSTKSVSFTITMKDNGFVIYEGNDTSVKKFNEAFLVDGIPCKITPLIELNSIAKRVKYKFSLIKFDDAVTQLSRSLQIENIGKQSEILKISLLGNNPKKTEQVINSVIDQFNKDGMYDRQLVSQRTVDFVNERFVYLSQELDSIETYKETYKRVNNLSFIEADATSASTKKLATESEVFQLETQIELAKLLESSLKKGKKYAMLPMNIGIANSGINGLTSEYNTALLEREKLLVGAGERNPVVIEFTDKIEDLRKNILASISIYQQELAVSLSKTNALKNENTTFFGTIPLKEKILRSIERQQSIKENLFILLLQKREEASINLAITAPSLKVIDYAITDQATVSPKKNIIYLAALLLGLLIPFGVVYLRLLLDTKIHNKLDFDRFAPDVPIVAEIPNIADENRIISKNDRSVLAEVFRILRTNINYLLPIKTGGECPVIFAESSIKGEGKTFVSLNLALTLASLDKKVLLIGADLRNPQLHKYLKVKKDQMGLSNYLYDSTTKWENLINKNIFNNDFLNIIFAGSVPPNPAELLSNGRFEELLGILKKQYDYIVVDTAPTLLVTDTLLISQLADLSLYVTRADHTDKKLLTYSKGLREQGKIKNMAYVINNIDVSKAGYGYGYSYGYGYGYNYGYGYGYGEEDETNPLSSKKSKWTSWFKK